MADPLSIVASAVGIADVCFRIVRSIRRLKHELATIDEELNRICKDAESLSSICDLIKDTFENTPPASPDSDQRSETLTTSSLGPTTATRNLWKHLQQNVNNCSLVVEQLDSIVQEVCSAGSGSAVLRLQETYSKLSKKKSRADDLRYYRGQLEMYRNGLHLICTIILMHDTRGIQDQNTRSFDDLTTDIHNLDENIQSRIDDLESFSQGQKYDSAALAALRELQTSIASAADTLNHTARNVHFDTPQPVSSIFTGREAHLQELRSYLVPSPLVVRDKQQRFVIHGLGGSGKTQFSCKFAENNRDSFWGVFWVDASSEERIKHTLGHIAKEYAQRERNVLNALYWLSNLQHNWLLIMDNADGTEFQLEKYFPKGNYGSILITTRNPAHKLHGNAGPGHYNFRGLGFEEATLLLLRACSQPVPWDESLKKLARKTAEALGYLALALIHAGAAIRNRLCTLGEYPSYFNRSWKRIRYVNTSSSSGRPAKRTSEIEVIVHATWELCYKKLDDNDSEEAKDAIQLLNVFAFFHRETISSETLSRAVHNAFLEEQQTSGEDDEEMGGSIAPLDHRPSVTWKKWMQSRGFSILAWMLRNRSPDALPAVIRHGRESGSLEEAKDRIRRALHELEQMSLVLYNDSKGRGRGTYYMHPVVHTWARERLSLSEQALYARMAASTLAASILLPPLGVTAEDDSYHLSLLAHVEHVQQCQTVISWLLARKPRAAWYQLLPVVDEHRLRAMAKFSLVYAKSGSWPTAARLLSEVRAQLHKHLGAEHERSRRASVALGHIYYVLSRGPDAQNIQRALVATCERALGPHHIDTLRAMGQLGRTLWQQGQFTEARGLQEQALRGLKRQLGGRHADTLDVMDSLGLTVGKFWKPHDLEEAYFLHKQAVEGMESVHGRLHERTLFAKENLSRVSVLIGDERDERRQAAVSLMVEVMTARRTLLGREHPFTLLAMANAAIANAACGHYVLAEQLLRDGLAIAHRCLESDHMGILFGQQTLATVLAEQGRYKEAVEILVGVSSRQKTMAAHRGNFHPDRLATLIELARCYCRLGDLGRSLDVADEAIRGFQSITDLSHPLAQGMMRARDQMQERVQKRACKDGDKKDDEGQQEAEEPVQFPNVIFHERKGS